MDVSYGRVGVGGFIPRLGKCGIWRWALASRLSRGRNGKSFAFEACLRFGVLALSRGRGIKARDVTYKLR
jgi:hypothetical protein